uniref:Uncharacterized protein n=1 Tax=Cucumis sativus TaxID=3659 RepID=A0A0A0LPT3_CUCSA
MLMEAITQIKRVKERTDEFSESTFLPPHFQVEWWKNEDGAPESGLPIVSPPCSDLHIFMLLKHLIFLCFIPF